MITKSTVACMLVTTHERLMLQLAKCVVDVHDWFDDNRLKLNEDKTQAIWLGSRQ